MAHRETKRKGGLTRRTPIADAKESGPSHLHAPDRPNATESGPSRLHAPQVSRAVESGPSRLLAPVGHQKPHEMRNLGVMRTRRDASVDTTESGPPRLVKYRP